MKLRNLLNEGKFREGDIVVPNVGPHKGVKHTIIYDFGDGRYNIQPIGLRPNRIQYALGAAGASEDQLKKVGSTPQKPAPNIIDTSDMKSGQSPFGENINEAPMDRRFQKEWESNCKALLNHIKHELGKGPKGQTRAQLQLYAKEITKAMEVPNKMAKIVGEGKLNKSTKLKDLLGEK
jgi:hypothetical protein